MKTLKNMTLGQRKEERRHKFLQTKIENIVLTKFRDNYFFPNSNLSLKTVALFFQLAKVHNLKHLAMRTFNFIQRYFGTVAETNNFLELDYNILEKKVSSCTLNIHSEIEVFNASERWLSHKFKDRSKHSKALLSNVRLSLLSADTLQYLKNNFLSFSDSLDCNALLKEVLERKKNSFENNLSVTCSHRYCENMNFNMYACVNSFHSLYLYYDIDLIYRDVVEVDVLDPLDDHIRYHRMAYCSRQVFSFICSETSRRVEKCSINADYESSLTTTRKSGWSRVADMFDDRTEFCVCSFIDKIFLIGGSVNQCDEKAPTKSCLQFDTKTYEWKEAREMKEARSSAACVAFEGRIVACGGENISLLKTVESYDVFADKWSMMPTMTTCKKGHSLVVVRNKLFVISTRTIEVFDSKSNTFSAIKQPKKEIVSLVGAIAAENKIFVLQNYAHFACYDVDKQKWSEVETDTTDRFDEYESFSCVKIPSSVFI